MSPRSVVPRWFAGARPAPRAWGAAVLAVALALLAPANVRAQTPADTVLYVVSNNTTLSVITNRATGALGTVATLAFNTQALARDPTTRRLYYLSSTTAGPVGRVAYYDPVTGTNTILNGIGSGGDNVVRMAYSGGLLYAIGDSTHGSLLYTISPATGAYTSLGSVHVTSAAGQIFPDVGDIAFDPVSGTLYANAFRPASAGGTSLYSINTATRIATHIGVATAAASQSALSFVNNTLYSGGGGILGTINTATGLGTLVAFVAGLEDFTTGPGVADLQLAMTASAPFTAGANSTYTLTPTNAGPFPATGTITVTDTLPAGITYSSFTGAGWACSAPLQVVTCTRAGPAAVGAITAIVLTVAVTNAAATSVINVAWVWSSTMSDQNESNNDASFTSAVAVRKVATTPDGATVNRLPSNLTTYTDTFVVQNTGSLNDTYNLAATVAPAAGVVTITKVNGVNGTTGTTGALLPNATFTATVTYTVASAAATGATAKITLTATSTALGTISNAGDITVTVYRAGISMTKQLYRDDQTTLVTGPAGVSPGEYVQYKVTVTSSGGAPANSVSVSDAIPAAVTYNTATGDAVGWTFVPAAGTVTASLAGALAAGASRYFWIRVRVK